MSKSALLELAERVEKASGPDRELDRDILITVRGMKVIDDYLYEMENWYYSLNGDEKNPAYPSPTSSLDAAMTLVPHGMEIALSNIYDNACASVGLNTETGGEHAEHKGGNLVLALTAACLRARAHMETTDADK